MGDEGMYQKMVSNFLKYLNLGTYSGRLIFFAKKFYYFYSLVLASNFFNSEIFTRMPKNSKLYIKTYSKLRGDSNTEVCGVQKVAHPCPRIRGPEAVLESLSNTLFLLKNMRSFDCEAF